MATLAEEQTAAQQARADAIKAGAGAVAKFPRQAVGAVVEGIRNIPSAVNNAMVAGQADMGMPVEARREAVRVQQLVNPTGDGVIPTTIVPKLAEAAPQIVQGLRGVPSAVRTGGAPAVQGVTSDNQLRTMAMADDARLDGPRGVTSDNQLLTMAMADDARLVQKPDVVRYNVVQPAEGLRSASRSVESATPFGTLAGVIMQANAARAESADEQRGIRNALAERDADTGEMNAMSNAQNTELNRLKTQLDLAKGVRESQLAAEGKLVEVYDPGEKGGLETKRSMVQIPGKGLVTVEQYQDMQRFPAVAPEDLAAARAAIADKADRAAVIARLKTVYPDVDFSAL